MISHPRGLSITPYNRAGLAAVSDLADAGLQGILGVLDQEQAAFIDRESDFRSEEYRWPRDPLHTWSRIWEYPYVYYHLLNYMATFPQGSGPTVADIGSGVTFFPFALARLGYDVVCTDVDSICEKDLCRAAETVPHSPGGVTFRLIHDSSLPFADSACDAAYCISVLEHVADIGRTVGEIARILKPGGLCLITCDINMQPADSRQLDCPQYRQLTAAIDRSFARLWPETTIHPVDLLTTKNSPYPLKRSSKVSLARRFLIQHLLRPLLGRKPRRIRVADPYLAVYGLVLRRKG